MAEPTVRMSGIVLASLMFQHVNSDSDVEGFILGESNLREQVTINDSQADHIHIEETYKARRLSPAQQFLQQCWSRDVEVVRRLLADNKQAAQEHGAGDVTEGEGRPREPEDALSNPHMIFVLLTPSKMTSPGSTHRTEYAAFISRSRTFINVPVLVNNLGLLEQLSYWKVEVAALRSRVREKRRSQGGKGVEEEEDRGRERRTCCCRRPSELCSHAPPFHSQTLTLDAFLFPAVCCGAERHDKDEDDEDVVSVLDTVKTQERLSRTNCRKRVTEATEQRERKRRKHQT
ncbi:hypothetical protein INR49_020916 [Caranx melampygus]|nr:hypothetical protein INR49_020916 [Caranx melampygus]